MPDVLRWLLLAWITSALPFSGSGEPAPAHYLEGTLHAFISLTDAGGKTLAAGDLVQMVSGDRVTTHLQFHFKDGSLDDETTVFTQRGTFRLISDHHIQRGPFFPHPIDVSIDAPRGLVTVRSVNKDGKEEVTANHMNLPADLYNGMLGSIVKNVQPKAAETTVSMLVMTPKPRLVKLAISPSWEDTFSVSGVEHKAHTFMIKIELGGVAGVIAPLIGKAPPDLRFWILPGDVPVALREEAPLFDGCPLLTFWMASPVWPHSESGK